MKKYLFFLLLILSFSLPFYVLHAESLAGKLKGRILLQVESKGEAWYVNPTNSERYYLGRAEDAYNLMRQLGIGIKNIDLNKIPLGGLYFTSGIDSDNDGLNNDLESALGTDKEKADSDGDGYNDKLELQSNYNPLGFGRLSLDNYFTKLQLGKIFLQVEAHGEAWYVNPVDGKRYFLGKPADAFEIMRRLGLGITNKDLNSIPANNTAAAARNNNDNLWPIFDKMAEAIVNKDVDLYNTFAYKRVAPNEKEDFLALADFLRQANSSVNKTAYINKWQDDKQAIYSTDYQQADTEDSLGYSQGMVTFINDKGNWKVLSVMPSRVWLYAKSSASDEDTRKKLQAMIIDSDKDGLTDYDENCIDMPSSLGCIKTDPNKRDTNGNGWWDGIEANMN